LQIFWLDLWGSMSSIFERVFLIPTPLSLRRFSCQLRISWTGCAARERQQEREREQPCNGSATNAWHLRCSPQRLH
jgi:hypothetical protein